MEVARNNLNIIREFIPQHQPPIPRGTCYMKVPLIISLSDALVLPKGVPLKALKGFEGYMVTESVSYLKDLYLALCQCLRREKNTQYTCIYKN